MFTAAGLPFLFIPITTASYAGLKGDTNQAAALINIARNLGGSIGVALVQTSLQQRQQFHQSRLVEHTLPSDIHLQEFIQRATEYFQSSGSSAVDAARLRATRARSPQTSDAVVLHRHVLDTCRLVLPCTAACVCSAADSTHQRRRVALRATRHALALCG